MDDETRRRVASWGAGPASPVYQAVDRLFPTFEDLLSYANVAYYGLLGGGNLIAALTAGEGHGVVGKGTERCMSLAADMRTAYDLNVQREEHGVSRFAVLMRGLNRDGIRGRTAAKAGETEEELCREVGALFDKASIATSYLLASSLDLFQSATTRKGVAALLDAGFETEDFLHFPIDFSAGLDDAEGPRYSVNEALQLHAAGVPAKYAAEMAEALVDSELPPIAEYFQANVPAEYAAAMLQAGGSPAEVVGMWEACVPLEYATA